MELLVWFHKRQIINKFHINTLGCGGKLKRVTGRKIDYFRYKVAGLSE